MLKEKVLNELKSFWNDEEAQGMMEYILLAVLVVGAVTLLREPLTNAITGSAGRLNTDITNFEGIQ